MRKSSNKTNYKYRIRNYKCPSGKILKIQGYENKTLDLLFKLGIKENDIVVGMDKVPKITYKYKRKSYTYIPDCYIKSLNLLIETKSIYTLRHGLYRNLAKMEACIKQGYKFQFHIW